MQIFKPLHGALCGLLCLPLPWDLDEYLCRCLEPYVGFFLLYHGPGPCVDFRTTAWGLTWAFVPSSVMGLTRVFVLTLVFNYV